MYKRFFFYKTHFSNRKTDSVRLKNSNRDDKYCFISSFMFLNIIKKNIACQKSMTLAPLAPLVS